MDRIEIHLMKCTKCGSNRVRAVINPNRKFAEGYPKSAIAMKCLDCGSVFLDEKFYDFMNKLEKEFLENNPLPEFLDWM